MGLFSKKEKKFPKVIILVGMLGVGKSTLIKKLSFQMNELGYQLSGEVLDKEQTKRREIFIRNNDIRGFRNFFNRIEGKRILDICSVLKSSSEEVKLIFDGMVLNTAYFNFVCANNNRKKMIHSFTERFSSLVRTFKLNFNELQDVLVLHIVNDNGWNQYFEREMFNNHLSKEEYLASGFRYDNLIYANKKKLKEAGLNYKKVDITKLKLNNEDSIRKFISKNLLVKK